MRSVRGMLKRGDCRWVAQEVLSLAVPTIPRSLGAAGTYNVDAKMEKNSRKGLGKQAPREGLTSCFIWPVASGVRQRNQNTKPDALCSPSWRVKLVDRHTEIAVDIEL